MLKWSKKDCEQPDRINAASPAVLIYSTVVISASIATRSWFGCWPATENIRGKKRAYHLLLCPARGQDFGTPLRMPSTGFRHSIYMLYLKLADASQLKRPLHSAKMVRQIFAKYLNCLTRATFCHLFSDICESNYQLNSLSTRLWRTHLEVGTWITSEGIPGKKCPSEIMVQKRA